MLALVALAAVGLASRAAAQEIIPLVNRDIPYDQIPYKVDNVASGRGPQTGYNICNATTENQESLCQTAYVNSYNDWCLWGGDKKDSIVGDNEGEAVSFCTKAGHGTRLIPDGAITAMTFVKTPDYVQVTGFIKQEYVNWLASDGGGEMDGHGADNRGNPLGGLIYSNAFTGQYVQIKEWHNFMGSGEFCIKACDPSRPNAADYCEHVLDRIGCHYNAPAAYKENVFESCLGESQDYPGVYTGADGKVSTYKQPPESLGEIQEINYTPRIPVSSSCTTYQSAQIFTGLPTGVVAVTASSSSVIASSSSASVSRASSSASRASGASTPSATGANSGAGSITLGVSAFWGVAVGVVGAAVGAVMVL